MNRRVFISMLALSICLLFGMYIAKIFFPQEFVFVIENERIVAIGKYIDSHAWAYYLLGICTSFLTYWLYLCAVCKKRYLNLKECALVLVTIGISIGASFIGANFSTYMSIYPMIVLPFIMKARLREVAIVYPIHGLAQILSLEIRQLPMYVQYSNMLSATLLTFECYFWLLLFYIIFNYKKSEV